MQMEQNIEFEVISLEAMNGIVGGAPSLASGLSVVWGNGGMSRLTQLFPLSSMVSDINSVPTNDPLVKQ